MGEMLLFLWEPLMVGRIRAIDAGVIAGQYPYISENFRHN